jgi:bile acid-coenzyme A ligase
MTMESNQMRTPRIPLGRAMAGLAAADPAAPAVTCAGRTLGRSELDREADRLASTLRELGVVQDDFVTIALGNSVEFFVSALACWKLGATPQPVSPALPTTEREAIVELADSKVILGVPPGSHGPRRCVAGVELADLHVDATRDAAASEPIVSPAWRAMTSGGSTGRPKLIVAAQPGFVDDRSPGLFGISSGGAQVVPGPLYHSGPFLFSMMGLFAGNHIVVLPRFDAAATLAAIGDHQVDVLMVVPTMMKRMLQLYEAEPQRFDLGSLQRLWHMAAPCPTWLKRAWIEVLGPERVWELYSGTEGQAATIVSGREWLEHPGTVGRAAMGEITILDADGAPVEPREVGEVYLRPSRDKATYRYVGATATRHGSWETLGDIGWMDEDGYLYLLDRRTDLILSGGANIYPAEVEAQLLEHPDVDSCAVVGVPDDDLGQRVHAVVHVGGDAQVADLVAHMSGRLVRYKVPRTWELVDAPVRDEAGKVRKSLLVERALEISSNAPVDP